MNIIHRSESVLVSGWRLHNALTLVLWSIAPRARINVGLRVADHVAATVALKSRLDRDRILQPLHVGVIQGGT